jgi:predicted RNase H-like HicB family nuclease
MIKSTARHTSVVSGREKLAFTAVFVKAPEGYVGFVEELPGANTQGATLAEARRNLKEAIRLVLDANRQLAQKKTEKSTIS